ncbi:MAG: hypothetical protein ACRDT6_06385 [Micromonosporaceae bacterium]
MPASLTNAPPNLDRAAVHPDLPPLREAVTRGDWPAVAAFFDRTADPDDREYAVALISDVAGSEAFLGHADSTLGRTLYGRRLIVAGWEIRSSRLAKDISREQFEAFHDHLRHAERLLIELTAEDPGNAAAWVGRLMTVRGLELGQNEARRRYDQLSRHVPHHFPAQGQLIQQLCPKWSGSHEKTHSFAVECMRAAPGGSRAPLAVLDAHMERFLDIEKAREATAYLQSPEVVSEIEEAADRSVRHPDFRPGFYSVETHNRFALLFCLIDRGPSAAAHFRAVGNLATESYWDRFGDPADVFSKYRRIVLKKG